jgi:hypothetical protein
MRDPGNKYSWKCPTNSRGGGDGHPWNWLRHYEAKTIGRWDISASELINFEQSIRMRLKWPRYIFEGTCTDQLLHWQCLDVQNLFLESGIVYRRQKPVKLHEQLLDFLRQTSCFMWLTHVVVWALVVWALVVWALVEWRANKKDWNVLF